MTNNDVIAKELSPEEVEVFERKYGRGNNTLSKDQLKSKAGETLINKFPDIIDTIRNIAEMTAQTDNQVKLIKEQGLKLLSEADAYATKMRAETDKIKVQGQILIETLDKANQLLMSSNVPDSAKTAYAENLHKWITTIVEQR